MRQIGQSRHESQAQRGCVIHHDPERYADSNSGIWYQKKGPHSYKVDAGTTEQAVSKMNLNGDRKASHLRQPSKSLLDLVDLFALLSIIKILCAWLQIDVCGCPSEKHSVPQCRYWCLITARIAGQMAAGPGGSGNHVGNMWEAATES